MSNDPFGRALTNRLNGYWVNHPGQRDFVHGTYHQGANLFWQGMGVTQFFAQNRMEDKRRMVAYCLNRARQDAKRRDDHWIRGENRNDRIHYNPSPEKQCILF